jgi:hypothetical protein
VIEGAPHLIFGDAMRAALSVALALLLAGCSQATGPSGDLRVETSKSVYTLPGPGNPSARVDYTVRNTGSAPVALAQCASVIGELQRREPTGEWVRVVSGPCAQDLAVYAPLVLAPGETAQGQVYAEVAGRYRINVPVAEEVGKEYSTYALSAEFTVRWLDD